MAHTLEPKQKRLLDRLPLSRVDLYLLTEVLSPFGGSIVFFVFIFLMFQVLRLAEFFIVHGVSLGLLVKMTLLLCMNFLPVALPVAFLIAVLVGFGRLSSDSELVALKASGMSLRRMSYPVLGVGGAVVVLSLALNLEWVPWGERSFKELLIRVGNTKAVGALREGTFTSGFYDLLIFADKVDSRTNEMDRVFIYDEREPSNPMAVVAQSGQILPLRADNDMNAAAILKLESGSIHRNESTQNTYQKIDFQEYKLFLKMAEGTGGTVIKPQMVAIKDLLQKIRSNPADSHYGREWRGEFWRRVSVALTPLIFVFLGMGFGTVRTRAVRSGAALTGFGVLVVYWGLQTGAMMLNMRALLPSYLALQLPNFIMACAAFWVFRRSSW